MTDITTPGPNAAMDDHWNGRAGDTWVELGRLLALRDARAQARTEAAQAAIQSFRALGGGWRADGRDPQIALNDVGGAPQRSAPK